MTKPIRRKWWRTVRIGPSDLERTTCRPRYRVRRGEQETFEQITIMEWLETYRYDIYRATFHVPNGGLRHPATATRLLNMGQKRGVPDLITVWPCVYKGRVYASLAIELKSAATETRVTANQREWLTRMGRLGWLACEVRGDDAAIAFYQEVYPEWAPIPVLSGTSKERQEALRQWIDEAPEEDAAKWADRRLAPYFGLSHYTVGRIREQHVRRPLDDDKED